MHAKAPKQMNAQMVKTSFYIALLQSSLVFVLGQKNSKNENDREQKTLTAFHLPCLKMSYLSVSRERNAIFWTNIDAFWKNFKYFSWVLMKNRR